MDQVVEQKILCETPFWKDPLIIFRNFNFKYCGACKNQIWNFIARLAIFATIASMVFMAVGYGIVIVPVVVSVVVVFGSVILLNKSALWKETQVTGRWKTLPSIDVVESDNTKRERTVEEKTPKTAGEKAKEQNDAMKALAKQTQAWIQSQANARGYDQVDIGPIDHSEKQKHPQDKVEGYENMIGNGDELPTSGIGAAPYQAFRAIPDYAQPAARNPFMNILLDEYKYNPTRPAAAPVTDPLVKSTLDDFFRVQWFSDPTDVFGRNQSQRQFVSQPVTSVPNDQKSYQEWLYKIPGKTCKEGGCTACLPGTDGGPITWLNQEF
ncbi:MAG: hypothetical protein EBT86_01250 [Actinobacteria bacterium]|nr:hypothetical protein [Actinomycetota bacterium]NDG27648.1 hypothetical protein [Pseudomonadota bacterium]